MLSTIEFILLCFSCWCLGAALFFLILLMVNRKEYNVIGDPKELP
jgi:hypothetical protein